MEVQSHSELEEMIRRNLDTGTLPIIGFLFVLFLSESSLLVLSKLEDPIDTLRWSCRILIASVIYSGCFFLPLTFPIVYYLIRERKNKFQQMGIDREWQIPSMIFFYLYFTIVVLGFLGSATTHSKERVIDYFHLAIFLVGLWISLTLSHNLQPLIRYIQKFNDGFNLSVNIQLPAILFLCLNVITVPLIFTARINQNLIAAGVTLSGVIIVSVDIIIIRRKIIANLYRSDL